MTKVLGLLLFFITFSTLAETDKVTGFVDFNYYYDSRDSNVFTQNTLLNINSHLEYFSFFNFYNQENSDDNFDQNSYYSEQNLRYRLTENSFYDFTAQWASAVGDHNDTYRLGVRIHLHRLAWLKDFMKSINLLYSVNLHVLQFDDRSGHNWQIEHTYLLNFFKSKFYLFGFIDQNILETEDKIVMEHQLGYRLTDRFFVVTEYRYNEFLPGTQNGFGYGLEYKIAL